MSLDLAKKVAIANDQYPKWSLGCCILKGGSVQAIGWNKKKCDPEFMYSFGNCSVHAEIHALRQMGFEAKRCVMYIARWRKGGGFGLSKPCAICQPVIISAGVKRVIYTIDDDTHGVWTPRSH
jgi:tRNA(Arg) A34 adenosine deaminase TadA